MVGGFLVVAAEEPDGPGEDEGAAQFERGAEEFGAGDEGHGEARVDEEDDEGG